MFNAKLGTMQWEQTDSQKLEFWRPFVNDLVKQQKK